MDKILIVDDEKSILEVITMALSYEGYDIDTAEDGIIALDKIQSGNYDLVLLDIKMPKMDGIEVLEKIKEMDSNICVVMISGHGNIETAVECTKKGAHHFIEKPPDLHSLKIIIRNALQYKKAQDELLRIKSEIKESTKLIGQSDFNKSLIELVKKFAMSESPVLITGESGTGKMIVANQIHMNSNFSDNPFTAINCSTLNENNFDSRLSGEDKSGTIYFDEICSLKIDIQEKIINLLKDSVSLNIANKDSKNIRYIFSTNMDLDEALNEKIISYELYNRINVLRIDILALRERPEDIKDLVEYFSSNICKLYNFTQKTFSEESIEYLKKLRWPGNIRELRNFIERTIFTTNSEVIEVNDITLPEGKYERNIGDLINKNLSLNDFQNESEKMFIMKMLEDYKYNISHTAEALKIQRSHIYKLMSKYNIPLPSKK